MTDLLPKVSVVIPVYNAFPWIPTLLDGLDQQTFRDFETIFVNDGSTDETADLLNAYAASRQKVKILHQPNKGPGAARNTGVDAAQGDFIVFVDADDAIAPSHLEDLYFLAISQNLEVAMCNGWRFYTIPGDAPHEVLVAKIRPYEVMTGIEWFETTINDGSWWGFPCMTMVRKDFLKRHSIKFPEGVYFEDNLWNVMIQLRAMRVAYTPKQSYYYRWTPGSILRDQSMSGKLRRVESQMKIIKKMWSTADAETSRAAALLRRLAARESRTLLAQLAELKSLRHRIALSRELQKKGFLARMFREVDEGMHRKRILRAYWFAGLGAIAELLRKMTPSTR